MVTGLRLTVVILFVANVAAAALIVLRTHVPQPPLAVRVPGVPALHLLHEVPDLRESSPRPRLSAPKAAMRCLKLGPFTTQAEMRLAFAALGPHVGQIQYTVADSAVSRGWWVYLSASDRAEALSKARELSARGVRDYYVITAGERQNSISLGLFQDPANARRRLTQIRALGFAAQLRQRVEQVPQYYIEFALPPQPGFTWQRYVAHPDILVARTLACG